MSDNQSNNPAQDDVDQTLACAGAVTRQFDAMTAKVRRDNAEIAALSEDLRRRSHGGAANPESAAMAATIRQIEQSLAGREAMAKELVEAGTAFARDLYKWADELKKREQQPVQGLLASLSTPIVTGRNALLMAESSGSASPQPINQEQDPAAVEMMRIDPPIASNPISESLTLVNLAGIPAMAEGVGGLVVAGTGKLAGLASNAIGGLTKAVEQQLTEGAASRIVPGGGLQASENLTGHLLARHVGQTEAQLMSRAMTDSSAPRLVSSFFDRATAEAAASQAIDANAGKITAWLTAGDGASLTIFGAMTKPVGKIVTQEGVSTITSLSVFVLVQDTASSTGYLILTGYPATY